MLYIRVTLYYVFLYYVFFFLFYVLFSLPARTSIIAAANPAGGHYNKAKTVSENLKMNSALLSRFDLVFILLDKPDEEMDNLLSEHVMALHSDDPKDLSFRYIRFFMLNHFNRISESLQFRKC